MTQHRFTTLFSALLLLVALVVFSSCNDDDNTYTIIYPDAGTFCMIHTDLWGQITAMTDDDDNYYTFTEELAAYNWDTEPLSSYRAYVLYCYTDNPAYVDFYDGTLVDVCPPQEEEAFPDGVKTDAVSSVVDIHLANNCSYINLVLSVYPAASITDQVWGCVKSTDTETGKTILTIYHEQLSTASSSTVYSYMSIPVIGYLHSYEEVEVVVNTYSGTHRTSFSIPNLDAY